MALLVLGLIITLASYSKILFGFFQQDEWLSLAFNHLLGPNILNVISQSFAPSVGHYQPLNTLILYWMTTVFRVNYMPYSLTSILLHLANVVMVYFLALGVFKEKKLSFITSLLFGVGAAAHQATSWVMADVGIHLSTFFALASLISFSIFLERAETKLFFNSLALLVVSLLFKETAIGFFIFYPIMFYVFAGTKLKKIRKFPILILVTGFAYLLSRVLMIAIPSSYANNNTLVTHSQSFFHLIYNMITIPALSLVQAIIPSSLLVEFSRFITTRLPTSLTGEFGTTAFDIFANKRVLESLNILLFASILYLIFLVIKKIGSSFQKKVIISAVLFIIVNSLIYALAPDQSGIMTIVESRNLYFISIATSFLLVFIFKKISPAIYLIIILNIILLNGYLTHLNMNASDRRTVLNQIKNDYPVLPKRTLVYIESDTSYYGLPDTVRIVPFQSGFGQTLLVWYMDADYFPNSFFKDRFLWEIKEQGYRQESDRGFGYFRDFGLLKQTIKEYNLPIDSVISYFWNGKFHTFTNTTEKTRLKLKN